MILVDSSVWIEAFKNATSTAARRLSSLLEEGTVVISGIILVELLQGARSKKEYNLLLNRLKIVPIINPDDSTWVKAGNLSFQLRRKGITIEKTIDIIIATIAIQNHLRLYSFDKHFELISKYSKLSLLH